MQADIIWKRDLTAPQGRVGSHHRRRTRSKTRGTAPRCVGQQSVPPRGGRRQSGRRGWRARTSRCATTARAPGWRRGARIGTPRRGAQHELHLVDFVEDVQQCVHGQVRPVPRRRQGVERLEGGALWISFSCGCDDGSPEDAARVERRTRA